MSYSERRAYLKEILRRYKKSNRYEKKIILDEFCAVCHYNRKYAVRLLHQRFKKIKHKRGRKVRYESARLLEPLKKIWLASDQACSKRLKTILANWMPSYEQQYGIMDDAIRGQLLSLSPATIDRLLKLYRVEIAVKMQCTRGKTERPRAPLL